MSKPSLSELQSWFQWIVTDPRGVYKALENPFPDSESLKPFRFVPADRDRCLSRYRAPAVDCVRVVQSDNTFPREDRLSLYAEGYFTRILHSLAEDFAAVNRLVGGEGFEILIADYLKEYPSRYENLAEVGKFFPKFLPSHEASRNLPFIVDLSELEWKIIEAAQAEDLPYLDRAELEKIEPEQWPKATFTMDSSLRLLRSAWNIDLFWKKEAQAIDEQHRYIRIFREDNQVRVESLEALHFEALQMASSGQTLGDIGSRLEDSLGAEGVAKIQCWFGDWLRSGIIRQVRL